MFLKAQFPGMGERTEQLERISIAQPPFVTPAGGSHTTSVSLPQMTGADKRGRSRMEAADQKLVTCD